jgi:hypothetical protein
MNGYFLIRKDRRSRLRTQTFKTEASAGVAADAAIETGRYVSVWVTDAETGVVVYEQHDDAPADTP